MSGSLFGNRKRAEICSFADGHCEVLFFPDAVKIYYTFEVRPWNIYDRRMTE
jgi:hypothetical protein